MMPRKLGILAGGGRLPRLLIDACVAQARPYAVIAFEGQADPANVVDEHTTWCRLGAGALILKTLKRNSVEDVVLAGSIRRPNWRELRPDLWGAGFLLRTAALAKGDDGLLRELLKVFEERGMTVIGADDVAPDLVTPTGCRTQHRPSETERKDIRIAAAAARDLGRADKGQAAVAANGQVVALENQSGTDAMLSNIGDQARGGVLVKCAKPEQDLRVDLPAVGPSTVAHAHAAGLAGIAIEAGRSLLIDGDTVVAEADRLGLFVLGIEPAAEQPDD